MDIAFILLAFVFGLGFKILGLPPLIGFLVAGFSLNYLGFESNQTIEALSSIGITLLLFTIGLKLNIRDLYKTEVWLGSISHMLLWTLIGGSLIFMLSLIGVGVFTNIDLKTSAVLAFALSFSSTVCIIKILEECGELKTRHGKVAVGILVMQDIFAVLFLALVSGVVPSPWAFCLFGLFFIKPLWSKILDAVGHGELLPLCGFLLALGSYELFYLVGIKGDLGALIIGMMIATHPKSAELSKSLLSFKDIFLIGFFLSIGFTALPTLDMVIAAIAICALIPLKFVLFFVLFSKLKLRARTSYLSTLVLSNYSEFGLIVVALLVSMSMLPAQWLVVVALAVSFSFVATAFIYKDSHKQYSRLKLRLKPFESQYPLVEDVYHQPKGAKILVIGLGRVGKGAYTALNNMVGKEVWGMDADAVRISKLKKKGFQVMVGDGENIDLWDNLALDGIELILLALPSTEDIKNITQQLQNARYTGKVASIARYEDEREDLIEAGSDKVFNFFTEAGTGFAEESLALIKAKAD